MHNYEYILIDSSKRSNGTACDFSYELNRPVRDIEKLELVYSSLSNTILTFTDRDYFYFQEMDGHPYIPNTNKKLYLEEDVISITEQNLFYSENMEYEVEPDRVFKFYEIGIDEISKTYHYFIIKPNEFNLPMIDFADFLFSKFSTIGSFDYMISYDETTDRLRINILSYGYLDVVSNFGLDFRNDKDIYLKIGFLPIEYTANNDFVSTNPTMERENLYIINRQITIPTNNYTFSSFLTMLQQKLNTSGSLFEYKVSLDDGYLSIEIIQNEENHIKLFRLPGGYEVIEKWGYFNEFNTPYKIKHVADKTLEGTNVYEISLVRSSYYPNELKAEIQDAFTIINMTSTSTYTIDILDGTTMKITNSKPFRINNNADSMPFIFSSNEFSNLQTSDPSTVFQGEINSIQFVNGSYTSDDVMEFLKLNLNSNGRSGYDAQISLSSFKITISNELRKFMIFFLNDNSVWKRFGFKNENTEYKNDHISDYTASLESSDYILVQIRGVATPITNKKTSGCFFIPIISTRYEVQTINENQSFNQSIYTGNLDLSTLDIKILNDEGDILESEELNLKMLIKCYK